MSPGTIILIRTLGCDIENRYSNRFERGPTAYFCKDAELISEACKELKTLVVAEVKRCENCRDLSEYYGIGVHYISPAV